MTKTQMLQQSKYDNRLMIESEEFSGVCYEIKNRAMCVTIFQDGQIKQIYGGIEQMHKFALEMLELCEIWGDVRT